MSEEILKIKDRILSNIDDKYSKLKGDFPYDFAAATAIEVDKLNKEIKFVEDKLDVENLYDEELERYINQRTGIERKPATKATTKVIITGQKGALVEKGILVSSDELEFRTIETKVLNDKGIAEVKVECLEAGSKGNLPAEAIHTFPITVQGLQKVTNPGVIINGYDIEPDKDLRQRYYDKIRTPTTSGNRYHYLNWAKSVVGVGDARVVPLWAGDNTVKVIIINSNKYEASEDLVNNVQEYIDPNSEGLGNGEAPIGAFCTVVSATSKPINVEVIINKEDNYDLAQIKESIKEKIISHLKDIAFRKNMVSYAQLGAMILEVEGVLDYRDLSVNNGTTNINIGNEEVAILGEVILNE